MESEVWLILVRRTIDRLAARLGAAAGLLVSAGGEGVKPRLLVQSGLSGEQEARLCRALRRSRLRGLARRDIFTLRRAPFGTEWAGLGIHHILVIPLWEQERFQGAIVLGFAAPLSLERPLRAELEEAAASAGLLLRLEEEHRHLLRRLKESQALLTVARALAQESPRAEMLKTIVRTAVESIPSATAGVIHLLAPDGTILQPMSAHHSRAHLDRSIQMRPGVGVAGQSLLTGETICVDDVRRDPRFLVGPTPPSYRSLLVAPMEIGGRKVGTLSLQSRRVAAFTPDDARFLSILAGQAAVVVENDRLFTELQLHLEELRRTQSYLVHAERLAAVGRLASSIAHQINNPLEGIKNFLALLAHRLPPGDIGQEWVRMVGVGFERIRDTVRQLQSVSYDQEAARRPCDLREVIGSALGMVHNRLLSEHIRLQEELPTDLPWVLAAPQQLAQAFLNLFLNAAEAMAEEGGTLTVRAWKKNEQVCVAVRDTGPGIPAAIREQLFEPFVTMKRDRAGLGLWACYGTIAEHGGTIEVEDAEGEGTIFTITLPALPPEHGASDPRPHDPTGTIP